MCVGVLEEAQVSPSQDASVMWVELNVYDLLMMRSGYGDCGG